MAQAKHHPPTLPDAFDVIEADPPWPQQGGKQKCPSYRRVKHAMDVVEVMLRSDVWRPAEDAHFWLWTTNTDLPWAWQVAQALGFRHYITTFTWVKLTANDNLAKGIGQYSYGSTEHLCLFKRGKPPKPDAKFRRSTAFLARASKHSAKPDEAYDLIESVSHKLPRRLSMFCRDHRDGWTVWGDEVP